MILKRLKELVTNMDNLISNNNPNFYWWFGAVEDRNDPLRLGRCRVRILGYHTADVELLPTESLPWAMPVMPANSAGSSGVGWSPTGAVEGSWVVGFFADGENGQHPMFFGTVGSIPGGLRGNDCSPEDGSGGLGDNAVGEGTGGRTGDLAEPTGNAKDYESYLEQYLDKNGPKNIANWSKLAKAAIMAQCRHESGNFRFFKEIWGPSPTQSRYEGRRDLGNNQPGDGKKYLGRGYIQITGRANYRACGRFIGKDLINVPELLQTKEAGAAAVVYFFGSSEANGSRIAKRNAWGDILAVTRAVNGGTNGLDERRRYFEQYKKKYGV